MASDILSLFFTSTMLVIAITDWRRLIIHDAVVVSSLTSGVVLLLLSQRGEFKSVLLGSSGAFALLLLVKLIGERLAGRPALGMGDVKLAAVLGLYLGFTHFLLALWLAALAGLSFLALGGKRFQQKWRRQGIPPGALPFSSFLALSGVVVMAFGSWVDLWIDALWMWIE